MNAFNEAAVVRDESGRFAAKTSGEPELSLVTSAPSWQSERMAELEADGYVPAIARRSAINVDSTDRAMFWKQASVLAEYGSSDTGGYAQMDSSARLSAYRGDDVSLRMPNRTAVRSFASAGGNKTFDVPVVADIDGQSVAGWVRCTPGENGVWSTRALNFPEGDHAPRVAEAVHAVLESRRARSAINDAGDLVARRQARIAARQGVKPHEVQSSALDSIGHDGTDLLVAKHPDYFRKSDQSWVPGTVVGRRVSPEIYNDIANSSSPGKAWAKYDMRHGESVELQRCPKCRRYNASTQVHSCGGTVGESSPSKRALNSDSRRGAFESLRSRWGGRSE